MIMMMKKKIIMLMTMMMMMVVMMMMTHFVRACAVEMHFNMSQEPLYTEIYMKNATPQNKPRMRTHILCEPAQSKCTSTFHTRHQKSHILWKFTGKMPRPRLSPERRHTLCASLRSRNTCQDFTRATLYGNLREKCQRPEWAPWSSTGLHSYRKNPSVWTRCLGK